MGKIQKRTRHLTEYGFAGAPPHRSASRYAREREVRIMNNYRVCLFCFILIVLPYAVFGQDTQTFPLDQITKSVVYLEGEKPKMGMINGTLHEMGSRTPGSNEFQLLTERVTGTGFFVRNDDNLFLATAGHVARSLALRVRLISSDTSGSSKSYPLDQEVRWIFSQKADVAVLRLNDPRFISDFLRSALDIKFLADTETSPAPGLPLVVIGFPLGLGVQNKFSPLRRETSASSGLIDLPRADTRQIATFFVLQDPSIGGYSGAPVFAILAKKWGGIRMIGFNATSCTGVIHATMSDNTGGKLGLVTPSKYVYELIK